MVGPRWAPRLALTMSLATFLGVGALIYLAFFDNVVPMTAQRLAAVEGIGIGADSHVVVTRDMCFSRENEAEAARVFVRQGANNGDALREEPDEIYEAPPMRIHMNEGCDVRSRRLDVPKEMRPGTYLFRSGLRYCNDIGRCQTAWLEPFALEIIGDVDRRLLRPRFIAR